jgi:hypothetical protein
MKFNQTLPHSLQLANGVAVAAGMALIDNDTKYY